MKPKTFIQEKIAKPVLRLLKQGVTSEKLALSLALGVIIGLSPLIGITTILGTVLALVFRLNLPAIQLMNWLLVPAQFILFLPYIRLGEKIFGSTPLLLSPNQLRDLFAKSIVDAISTLGLSYVRATIVWFLIGSLATFPLYKIVLPILRKFTNRTAAQAIDTIPIA